MGVDTQNLLPFLLSFSNWGTAMATTNTNFVKTFVSTTPETVSNTIQQFQRLKTDDQLAALWFIYVQTGISITPAAPGAARLQLAAGLLDQVKNMTHEEQLQFMRDLANKVNTPATRAYGVLSANTKLAFWYRLAQWMEDGTVIPMPAGYKMSPAASEVLSKLEQVDFNQQITILRQVVVNMGVDPLA